MGTLLTFWQAVQCLTCCSWRSSSIRLSSKTGPGCPGAGPPCPLLSSHFRKSVTVLSTTQETQPQAHAVTTLHLPCLSMAVTVCVSALQPQHMWHRICSTANIAHSCTEGEEQRKTVSKTRIH